MDKNNPYNITAYSTALFSTWINVEELNLLIDAGDGITSNLMQKSRKIKHVFITHPDRDHLNGLPQFIQLNSREGFPIIHYPKDSGSFQAMQSFLSRFDPHVNGSKWIGIADGERIPIKKGFEVVAMRNNHILSPKDVDKSLSYKLFEIKSKLKPAFKNLDKDKIRQIAIDKGSDFLTEIVSTNIISFSGDTPVDSYEKWDKSEILIHESTFLGDIDNSNVAHRHNKHSSLDEVLRMAKEISINCLILNHFSSRYSKEEILFEVRKQLTELGIKIPVYLILPGETHRNILSQNPINA